VCGCDEKSITPTQPNYDENYDITYKIKQN